MKYWQKTKYSIMPDWVAKFLYQKQGEIACFNGLFFVMDNKENILQCSKEYFDEKYQIVDCHNCKPREITPREKKKIKYIKCLRGQKMPEWLIEYCKKEKITDMFLENNSYYVLEDGGKLQCYEEEYFYKYYKIFDKENCILRDEFNPECYFDKFELTTYNGLTTIKINDIEIKGVQRIEFIQDLEENDRMAKIKLEIIC